MDDSTLDCCDHIRFWKKKGIYVKVINVFTKFEGNHLSKIAKDYIRDSGFVSASKFEKARKHEEESVQNTLKLDCENLNYFDRWFRVFNNKPIYPNRFLSSYKISPHDKSIIKDIGIKLSDYLYFNKIFIPLGIGGHIDHLIVRNRAEEVFPKSKLGYYLDYPYALNRKYWSLKLLWRFLISKKSIKSMSKEKINILKMYRSQYPILFAKEPKYSEVILYNLSLYSP